MLVSSICFAPGIGGATHHEEFSSSEVIPDREPGADQVENFFHRTRIRSLDSGKVKTLHFDRWNNWFHCRQMQDPECGS